jgi:hypothetical protein
MIGTTLARVLARPGMGGVTYRHIRAMMAEGLAQRWKAEDGSVVVTELLQDPAGRYCLIWLAEGDIRSLLELHETILEWAKAEGCNRIRVGGRRGWGRVLEGYHEISAVFERSL